MSKTTDRSKQWLIDAFLEILKDKSYDEITIKDITIKANLARRTFYRLFENKDELLNYYYDEIIADYFRFLNSNLNKETSFEVVLTNFFTFWYARRNKMKILIKRNLFLRLMTRRRKDTGKIYMKFNVSWHNNVTEKEAQYIMDFFIGGYWNIISIWLNKNEPEKPEYISNLLINAIKIIN